MKLYAFDSCPFCVRVRALLGIKNINYDLEYIVAGELPLQLQDNVDRFTVPILELTSSKNNDVSIMQESAVILRYLDQLDGKPVLSRYQVSEDVGNWLSRISRPLDSLCYPRMRFLNLPELSSEKAKSFFETSRKERIGMSLDQALVESTRFSVEVQQLLSELPALVNIKALKSGSRDVSIEDIDLFAALRNLSMVGELNFPAEVKLYIERLSEMTKVALYPAIYCSDFGANSQ